MNIKNHFVLNKGICRLIAALLFARGIVALGANYDVYLFAGQSNMDGRAKASNLTEAQRQPFTNVIIYYRNPPHSTDGWKPLEPGYSTAPHYQGGLPSPTFGPEVGFAFAMTIAQPEQQFAFIKGSKGGTSLSKDWNPGIKGKPETQGPCYRNFLETIHLATSDLIKTGSTFKLCGLLWHQGESDAKSSTEAYQERLVRFIARIREDTGVADLPVVVGEVFDNGKRDTVRAAIKIVGHSSPSLGFVSAASTHTLDAGTHFNAASQLLMGQRYASAMLKILHDQDSSNLQTPSPAKAR